MGVGSCCAALFSFSSASRNRCIASGCSGSVMGFFHSCHCLYQAFIATEVEVVCVSKVAVACYLPPANRQFVIACAFVSRAVVASVCCVLCHQFFFSRGAFQIVLPIDSIGIV